MFYKILPALLNTPCNDCINHYDIPTQRWDLLMYSFTNCCIIHIRLSITTHFGPLHHGPHEVALLRAYTTHWLHHLPWKIVLPSTYTLKLSSSGSPTLQHSTFHESCNLPLTSWLFFSHSHSCMLGLQVTLWGKKDFCKPQKTTDVLIMVQM